MYISSPSPLSPIILTTGTYTHIYISSPHSLPVILLTLGTHIHAHTYTYIPDPPPPQLREEELELDDINKHPCMATILLLLDQLHGKMDPPSKDKVRG